MGFGSLLSSRDILVHELGVSDFGWQQAASSNNLGLPSGQIRLRVFERLRCSLFLRLALETRRSLAAEYRLESQVKTNETLELDKLLFIQAPITAHADFVLLSFDREHTIEVNKSLFLFHSTELRSQLALDSGHYRWRQHTLEPAQARLLLL